MTLKVTEKDIDGIEITISSSNKYKKEIISFIENIDKFKISFYKNNLEVFIDVDEILFFETELSYVSAHTKDNVYKVKYKLYELELILPNYFKRISKSSIVNKNKIFSITKNVTLPGVINFNNTYKKTFISRMYYKLLKEELK